MDISEKKLIIQKYTPQPLWGNWYLKEVINAGATGVVYRAEARRVSRTDVSAVKAKVILPSEFCKTSETKLYSINEKLIDQSKESEIMEKLKKCPYIVSYEDEDVVKFPSEEEPDGCIFFIRMELLQNLSDLIENEKIDLTEAVVLKIGHDIARAVKAIHDIGYMHRDIKPQNIFYSSKDDTYMLGDFDISKDSNMGLTIAGTPHYIAPEIVIKSGRKTYDNTVDIYSLGITLYTMMNDMKIPFYKELQNEQKAYNARVTGTPLPRPTNASQAFSDVILKACAYNPKNRYKSIDELIKALKSIGIPEQKSIPRPDEQESVSSSKDEESTKHTSESFSPEDEESTRYASEIFSPEDEESTKYASESFSPEDEESTKYASESFSPEDEESTRYASESFSPEDEKSNKYADVGSPKKNNSTANSQNNKPANQKRHKSLLLIFIAAVILISGGFGVTTLVNNHTESMSAADQEEAESEYKLGDKYYYGDGVPQDYSVAFVHYNNAAQLNYSPAQNNLGNCYFWGRGVSQDYTEAFKWYKKSANQNNADAQNNLGNCYSWGRGVNQDYVEAVKWYKKSANNGNAFAQNNLGDCYYYGEGVNQDYAEAVKWYEKAAEQGNSDAKKALQKPELIPYISE